MDICTLIAQCLADPNSPAYQQLKKLTEQGYGANPTAPTYGQGVGAGKDLNLGGTCDNDRAFGFATQIVDFLNNAVLDVFQAIEVTTNSLEKTEILLDAVPILSDAIAYTNQIVEELAENYLSSYTQVVRDELRCGLYCLMISNSPCGLTFNQIADYFLGLANTSIQELTIADAIDTLFGAVPLSGSAVVYGSLALLSTALAYGSNWAGIDALQLQRIVQSFFNDPDNDWATLCTACSAGTWYKDFNFQDGVQGWIPTFETSGAYPNVNQAVYVQGVWKNVTLSGNAIMTIERSFPSANITRTVIHYEMDVGSLGQRRAFYTNGLNIDLNNTAGVWVTDVTRSYTGVTKLKIALHKGSTAGTPFRVKRVELYGTGTYPF